MFWYIYRYNFKVQAGSPVADTFAVVARKNSAILVLGDGVNWGGRAALASRAAVHGAMDYLNTALFGVNRLVLFLFRGVYSYS